MDAFKNILVSRYVYAKTSISGKVVVIVVVEVPEICTNSPSKNSVVGDVVCPSGGNSDSESGHCGAGIASTGSR
jgi:hypothetical protein